jgi:hypothetical protein
MDSKLECSAWNEAPRADLVEVVIDPPSPVAAVTVERRSRASASGNRRDPTQTDDFNEITRFAGSANVEQTTKMKRTTPSVALPTRTENGKTPPSTSDSSALAGAGIPALTASNKRASSRPNQPPRLDGHEASRFIVAHIPSSVPAAAVPAGVSADFIEKIDSKSGRSYWVNLKTKTRSWVPPASLHAARARNDAATTSVLSATGHASATNFATLERKMPESPDRPSCNAQGSRNVNIELEKGAQFAAPASMQQEKQKSTCAQRQDNTQQEHATPATISTATLAAERMRRQNLADLAAAGDTFAFKLAGSGRRTPESRATLSPNVRADQNASIELEEVVAHSSPWTKVQGSQSAKLVREKDVVHSVQTGASAQRRDIMRHIRSQTMAGVPDGAEADALVKDQPAVVISDANASVQPEVQRARVSHAVSQPSEASPFDEKDLKSAKRHEEKAAARSARK